MKEDSAETASSIRHDPVIQKASEYHGKSEADSSKAKIYLTRASIMLFLLMFGVGCEYLIGLLTSDNKIMHMVLNFCMYFFYAAALFVAITTVLLSSEMILSKMGIEGNFVYGIFNKYSIQLGIILVCFLFSYHISPKILGPVASEQVQINVTSPSAGGSAPTVSKVESSELELTEFFSNLASFYMAVGMIFGVFFLKNILIYALSYNVHFAYYSERIEKNTDKINLLKSLNGIINAGYTDDIDVVCSRLMQVIGKESGVIRMHDLKTVISEEDAAKVFYYLDKDRSSEVLELQDLKIFYTKTLAEQQQISNGLIQKNSSVDNLNFVATFVCIILSFSIFFSYMNTDKDSKNQIAIIMTGLISGGYIFADIIKNFLGSLIFVFFIRPFEIDDFVLIENKIYKVKAINILTSTLSENKLSVVYPNNKLLGTPVTNFRLSKAYENMYTYPFEINGFRAKREDLKKKIDIFMMRSPKVFRKRVYFKDLNIMNANSISVTIVVGFNLEDMNIKKLRENQEQFVLDLHDIFREVELIPFKS